MAESRRGDGILEVLEAGFGTEAGIVLMSEKATGLDTLGDSTTSDGKGKLLSTEGECVADNCSIACP